MEPLERYSLRTLMKFYINLDASVNINILNEEVTLSLNFLGWKAMVPSLTAVYKVLLPTI